MPTFFAAAKKVGAAPHRGNANRPLTNQAKANKPSPTNQAHNPNRRPGKKPHLQPTGPRAGSPLSKA
ncbi:hypothetical protein B2G74_22145 [Burkholderia sp. A27]|nr:hypothetical protein B2G74_22145 [Burkholderia sp. A27]